MNKLEKDRQADAIRRLNRMDATLAIKVEAHIRGFPDVLCMHRGQTYYFEFKRPGLKLTPIQRAMRRKIKQTGHTATRVTCFQDCLDAIEATK